MRRMPLRPVMRRCRRGRASRSHRPPVWGVNAVVEGGSQHRSVEGNGMNLTRESVTRGTAVASEIPIGIMPVGGGTAHPHCAAGPAHTAEPRSRAQDFLSLTKPRVLLLVLIATGLGGVMAAESLDVGVLAHALLGTALVVGGTAALNQYIERAHDARMRRTAHRPLPAGRLQPQEGLRFGIGLSLAGTAYLALTLNLLTSLVGLAALLTYLLLYTPAQTPLAPLHAGRGMPWCRAGADRVVGSARRLRACSLGPVCHPVPLAI